MSTELEPFDFTKIRLWVEADLGEGQEIVLDKGQTHYLVNVMRLKPGAHLLLFNGRDGEWVASLTRAGKRDAALSVLELSRSQTATSDLELLFAPVKKIRNDFLIEKAVELGVSRIRPVVTRYTNAKVRTDKMQLNAIEAAEQSGRMDIPEILPPIKLTDLIATWDNERGLIFCDEARDAPDIANALQGATHKGPWSLLIGPEGGFEDAERASLKALPTSLPVSLGPRIMRADTAALAALAAYQSAIGDWKAS